MLEIQVSHPTSPASKDIYELIAQHHQVKKTSVRIWWMFKNAFVSWHSNTHSFVVCRIACMLYCIPYTWCFVLLALPFSIQLDAFMTTQPHMNKKYKIKPTNHSNMFSILWLALWIELKTFLSPNYSSQTLHSHVIIEMILLHHTERIFLSNIPYVVFNTIIQ